jgi:hypothetical protein
VDRARSDVVSWLEAPEKALSEAPSRLLRRVVSSGIKCAFGGTVTEKSAVAVVTRRYCCAKVSSISDNVTSKLVLDLHNVVREHK